MTRPMKIVGIGGTTSENSSTEKALAVALASAKERGADVELIGSKTLAALPHYAYGVVEQSTEAAEFVAKIRQADGLILATPCYHGSVSGLMKNALDYVEETARDSRVYLDGVPVGLIVNAYGWQAIGPTLTTMRSIVHALRGWPTPFGAGIKVSSGLFDGMQVTDADIAAQLALVGSQVADFTARNQLAAAS
ncbi:NAD(P)H-dependent oxidoreductase [Alteromonas sp. 1_MG-2023]|uniref:NADPH-dependent FMN reductase n=1 Tax=unclassified Alteromonas TaxID=2614992 RepID=UPI0026E3E69E|nr:NAD(P)H-dependent oxidoreductase [Alteromonas sp. 1_MG-2023]MDO6475145.1 NAD(P)H-dependent oxidoreductase [Alteromonas sp. 1_MG-2023]